MRMARVVTGGRGFLCTDAAYHGSSAEVGKLNHVRRTRDPEIRGVPFPQKYRPLRADLTETALAEA